MSLNWPAFWTYVTFSCIKDCQIISAIRSTLKNLCSSKLWDSFIRNERTMLQFLKVMVTEVLNNRQNLSFAKKSFFQKYSSSHPNSQRYFNKCYFWRKWNYTSCSLRDIFSRFYFFNYTIYRFTCLKQTYFTISSSYDWCHIKSVIYKICFPKYIFSVFVHTVVNGPK